MTKEKNQNIIKQVKNSDFNFLFDYLKNFNYTSTLELYSLLSDQLAKNKDTEKAYTALMLGFEKAVRLDESYEFVISNIDKNLIQLLKERQVYDLITYWNEAFLKKKTWKRNKKKYFNHNKWQK